MRPASYDPYDPPPSDEEDPQEHDSFLPGGPLGYGSISYPRSFSMTSPSRALRDDKNRCRMITGLFGSLALIVVLVLTIATRGTPAEVPPLTSLATESDAGTSTLTAENAEAATATTAKPAATEATAAAEPAPEQTSPAPAQTSAAPAQTEAAPAQTSAAPAQTSAAPAQTSAAPAQTSAAPAQTSAAPEQTSPAQEQTAAPSSESASSKAASTTAAATEAPAATKAAKEKKEKATKAAATTAKGPQALNDNDFLNKEMADADQMRAAAAERYNEIVDSAERAASDLLNVAKTAALQLEASVESSAASAVNAATYHASQAEQNVDRYASMVEERSKDAIALYENYMKSAMAAGAKLQAVLSESSANDAGSISDVVAAAQKIQNDWKDYQALQQKAADDLKKFQDTVGPTLATGGFPTVLMAKPENNVDWRNYVPGYGKKDEPDWMKYIHQYGTAQPTVQPATTAAAQTEASSAPEAATEAATQAPEVATQHIEPEATKEAESAATTKAAAVTSAAVAEATAEAKELADNAEEQAKELIDNAEQEEKAMSETSKKEPKEKAETPELESADMLPPSTNLDFVGQNWQDLVPGLQQGNIPKQWMGCGFMPEKGGLRIGCCLQTVCGSVLKAGMEDPATANAFTKTLSCTSMNGNAEACFDKVTDKSSLDLQQCLQCNQCMAKPSDVACPADDVNAPGNFG